MLALAGCGPGTSGAIDPRLTPITSFPTTVEGNLEWSVVEGDSEEIGVPEGPSAVRATLGAKSEYAPDGYVVTALERL